jgi:hypothetical protein
MPLSRLNGRDTGMDVNILLVFLVSVCHPTYIWLTIECFSVKITSRSFVNVADAGLMLVVNERLSEAFNHTALAAREQITRHTIKKVNFEIYIADLKASTCSRA